MHKALLQFSLILLCLGIGTQVFAEPELKGSPAELAAHLSALPLINPPNTVTLTGQASSSIYADAGRVTLSVLTRHERFQDALQANYEIRRQLISALTKAGIAQEHIQESHLSSTPQYGFFGDTPKHYSIENAMRIEVFHENELQQVAQRVDRFPEVQYRELEFIYPEKATRTRELLASALEDVQLKKQLYEQQLGVSLKLKTFSDGQVLEHSPFTGLEQRKLSWGEYSRSSEGDAPILTFGEILLESSVTVEYSIEHP